jgi:hypothetical protein
LALFHTQSTAAMAFFKVPQRSLQMSMDASNSFTGIVCRLIFARKQSRA